MARKKKEHVWIWVLGGVAIGVYFIAKSFAQGISDVFQSPQMLAQARMAFQMLSANDIAVMKKNYDASTPQQKADADAIFVKLGVKRPF